MNLRLKIPLKYKFLGVLMFIMLLGFSTFFTLAYRTFSEDKKLFVMELNLSLLKTAMSDVKADLKSRMDELQVLIPKVYAPDPNAPNAQDPFHATNLQHLPEELLGVSFYRQKLGTKTYELTKQFKNTELFQKRTFGNAFLQQIEKNHPAPLSEFIPEAGMQLVNRSVQLTENNSKEEVSILSILIPGNFVNDESKSIVIVVDLLQDFLRKKLQQSEIAEVFLVSKNGHLLSHSSPTELVTYSNKNYDHPVVARLQAKQFPRESLELMVNNEAYLCNVAETGLTEIYAISQIKQSEAFVALKTLMRQTLLTGLFILSIALIFSIIFASRLTSNIQKLRVAAENIGRGDLNTQLDIHSNDEVQAVAESFEWMSNRISELITESAAKARMEDELETAKLVQSTLLTAPNINSDSIEIVPHYWPASECGGDVWDAFLAEDILTVVIGDATGHGAPAAIVTAVAKSCFSTLNGIYKGRPLVPEQFLEQLNSVIYSSCKGQLLMTMCLLQLDLRTGELLVCNAGHESPFCLRAPEPGSVTEPVPGAEPEVKKGTCEVFFARGERLGFTPDSKYESVRQQLRLGDSVLLYTDGISEAVNSEGKQWGERAVKKALSRNGMRPLEQIRDDLIAGAKEFMGDATQADDITFVLLSWKKAVTSTTARTRTAPRDLGVRLDSMTEMVENSLAVTIDGPIESLIPSETKISVSPTLPTVEETKDPLLNLIVSSLSDESTAAETPKSAAEAKGESILNSDPPFSMEDGEFCALIPAEYCTLEPAEFCSLEPAEFCSLEPAEFCELEPQGFQSDAAEELSFEQEVQTLLGPSLTQAATEKEGPSPDPEFTEENDNVTSLLKLVTDAMQENPSPAHKPTLVVTPEDSEIQYEEQNGAVVNSELQSLLGVESEAEESTLLAVPPPQISSVDSSSSAKEIGKSPTELPAPQNAADPQTLLPRHEKPLLLTRPSILELAKNLENTEENPERNYARIEELARKSGGSSDDEAA